MFNYLKKLFNKEEKEITLQKINVGKADIDIYTNDNLVFRGELYGTVDSRKDNYIYPNLVQDLFLNQLKLWYNDGFIVLGGETKNSETVIPTDTIYKIEINYKEHFVEVTGFKYDSEDKYFDPILPL